MLIGLVAALLAVPQSSGATPPNIVVVLVDDIGRDKIRCYGDHPEPAPTTAIDAFAGRGVMFRNAWSYPVCSPTRAALLTGRYGERTGIMTIINASDGVQTPLSTSEVILPEVLEDHLPVTLGKWHLKDSQDAITAPLDHGFEVVSGFRGRARYHDWVRHENGTLFPEEGYYPSTVTRRAIDIIQRVDQPLFVYHCPILAHAPFHAPPSYLHTQGNPSFTPYQHIAMVEALDRHFALLMQAIDLDDTYVFFIGDNGSPNGTILPPWPPSHGKRTPYEGAVRVPFIVAGPGVAQGEECDELVHVTDVFATVMELVGRTVPQGVAEDSVSFAPLLSQPHIDGERDHLYFRQAPFPGATTSIPEFRAIRTKRWKLIEFSQPTRYELYDLSVDENEEQDLLVSSPGPMTDMVRDRLLDAFPVFP